MPDRGPPEDYTQVEERIRRFYDAHPHGRIVTDPVRVVQLQTDAELWDAVEEDDPKRPGRKLRRARVVNTETGITRTFLVARAHVYRDEVEQAAELPAGTGEAWELLPGRTPYTRDSEGMNAETSAIGRAIKAAGIDVGRGASAEEVRGRSNEVAAPAGWESAEAYEAGREELAGLVASLRQEQTSAYLSWRREHKIPGAFLTKAEHDQATEELRRLGGQVNKEAKA
jgi:hypothetical protein